MQRYKKLQRVPVPGESSKAAPKKKKILPPLIFQVDQTALEPKAWRDTGNVNSGNANTRTNVTIGAPAKSTVDVSFSRPAGYGHDHTNEPASAKGLRNKRGHFTNKSGGAGREYSDFQINSKGENRTVTYHAPHAAGQINITAKIRGRTDAAAVKTLSVTASVSDLVSYEPVHANEVLVGRVDNHGSNHWGTQGAINRMRAIVNAFRGAWVAAAPRGQNRNADNAPTIQINDISLPYGGMYDFRGTWQNPHKTHRFGRDIDISRRVIVNGRRLYLRPGRDQSGRLYTMLNNAVGVNPEDRNHWHVDV